MSSSSISAAAPQDPEAHRVRPARSELERLLRVGTQLAGTVQLEVAARVIIDAVVEASPGATVAVYRRDGARWALVARNGTSEPGPPDEPPDPHTGDDTVALLPLKDGDRVVACIAAWFPVPDEQHQHLLQHLGDVAGLAFSKILLHERTAHQARHDLLTGLVNRGLLRDHVEWALAGDAGIALIFLDLDRFKTINDTLGHDVGDQLLVEVARRIGAAVRPGDTVSRLGGDEFVVLCRDVGAHEEALSVAARIADAIAPPIDLDGRTITVSGSQGVVLSRSEDTAETLLRDADAAMYRAKARGRNRIEVFDQELRVALEARVATEARLRDAMRDGRLLLHYQPLVALGNGRLRAVEALLRYQSHDGQLITAGDFIAVAEETNLVVELGAFVLDEAARQLAAWRRDLGATAPPRVLINVSARQLSQAFDGAVTDALARHDLPPTTLALELTEHGLIDHGDEVLRCLAALRRRGIEVGIDDFGTGYSSLTYLKRFPVDFVKIDREFIHGMVREPEDASIVDAIVRLTQALDLQAVAEGVETDVQRRQLVELGCELAQGHLFGAPVAATTITREIRSGLLRVDLPPVRPAPAAAAHGWKMWEGTRPNAATSGQR